MDMDPAPAPSARSGYKKKMVQGLGLNQHTSATKYKEALTPPTHKNEVPSWGGGGRNRCQNRKIHWGSISVPK